MKKLSIRAIMLLVSVSLLFQVPVFAINTDSSIQLTTEERSMIDTSKTTYDSLVKELDLKFKEGLVDEKYYNDYKSELAKKYLITNVLRRTPEEEKAAVNELKLKFKVWSDKAREFQSKKSNDTAALRNTNMQALASTASSTVTYGSNSFPNFDRSAAEDYIDTWWDDINPNYDDWVDEGVDCCNFGSQVLVAGGIAMTNNWYNKLNTGWDKAWNKFINTNSFSCNPEFYDYFSPKVYSVEKVSGTDVNANFSHYYNILWPGDIISLCDSSGNPFHMFEVSGYENGQIYLSAHTDSWHDKLLKDTCTTQGSNKLIIYRIKSGY